MKNLLLITVLTVATVPFSTENHGITEASLPISSATPDASRKTELAEAGGKKFGGRKAQRKRNKRTKKINRKFGVGFLPTGWEVNYV